MRANFYEGEGVGRTVGGWSGGLNKPFICFILSIVVCVQGKVAIITGSAQGLGKAFACKLLSAGAKVGAK